MIAKKGLRVYTKPINIKQQHHKNQIFEEMKETEKIINQIEDWSREEGTDRASVVIMADLTSKNVDLLCYGTSKDMACLASHWMKSDKTTARDIYVAACLYAHKHIGAKERKKINDAAAAIAAKDE